MRHGHATGFATIALIGLGLSAPVSPAPAQEAETPAIARVRAMHDVVKPIAIVDGDGAEARLIDEPIYRFNDPTRDYPDGTVWAFGERGRPPALVTIGLKKPPQGGGFWLLELTSLASKPVVASEGGKPFWKPGRSGIESRSIPGASSPAGEEAKRSRQARDLARRFEGFELFKAKDGGRDQRFEMRLLPQPVHRYRDEAAGILDGSIFLLVYGQNPEIALVIEAQGQPGGEPGWTYGLARISSAELHVELDDREVAKFDQLSKHAATDTYGIAVRPAPGL